MPATRLPLSNTEAALMRRLAERAQLCVSMGYGRGPMGGRVSYGTREFTAAQNLALRGLVEVVKRDREVESRHGYTRTHCDLTVRRAELDNTERNNG